MENKLQTMDAQTLMNTPLPALRFFIDTLLPQGLHVLAGSPKIGKSWLSLWLALQVSKGEKIWGFSTLKSSVLYLCLEDSFARIQNRLFNITDDAPSTLHFAITSGKIGNDLECQIETFIKENENTGIIIIDTLQKVRDNTNNASNSYSKDYEDIDVLKKLADKYCVAILLVHHLRKTNDTDPINMISGSTGISGSADTNFVLQKEQRNDTTAKLICVGRDTPQREIYINFNTDTYLWEPLTEIEVNKITTPSEIVELCNYVKKNSTFNGTATELSENLATYTSQEYSPSSLKKKIIKYISELSKNGITYTDKRTFKRREFNLEYDAMTDMTLKRDTSFCDINVS